MEFTDPGDILLLGVELQPVTGRVLLIDPNSPVVGDALRARGCEVIEWSWIWSTREVVTWPPTGTFDAVILHLPLSRDLTTLTLEVAADRLAPNGMILVYGANHQGIKSVDDHLAPWFDRSEVVIYKHRQRVIKALRTSEKQEIRSTLEAWQKTFTATISGHKKTFISYPGMFAHGQLDAGTRLLLNHLPPILPNAKLLDMGSGTGVLASAMQLSESSISIDAVDVNAFSVESTKQNVPGVNALWGDSWNVLPADAKYDLILSNPPVHQGAILTTQTLEYFISKAKTHLVVGGSVRLVVQGTIPVKKYFDRAGLRSALMAEDAIYQVWEAR